MRMDGIMVLGMVGVAISLMSGLPEFAAAKPSFTALVTATTFAVNIGLQIFTAILFWGRGRKAAVTIGLITGNTNVALVACNSQRKRCLRPTGIFRSRTISIYILPLVAVPIYQRIVWAK